MCEKHETTGGKKLLAVEFSELSERFEPYAKGRVINMPIEVTEHGGGYYVKIPADKKYWPTDNVEEQPDEEDAEDVGGGFTRIPLGNTTECLYALKNYGEDEEIRDAVTRKLWMMLKEEREERRQIVQRKMPRFELTAEQKEEEELFYSLFDDDGENSADDMHGEINTLGDCLYHIDHYGDDEAERDTAVKNAWDILQRFDGNIGKAIIALHEAESWLDGIRDDAMGEWF